ncbi:MAG: shikimate kinase [Acutalibacteraceae bacterium]|nr:shikimate kinase [Acutalibacteraceae bacterium]
MYGLLGRKLGHSLSPQIHSHLCDYEYKLYPTEPENLDAFFTDTSLKGYNITIPYKIEAFNRCDERSEVAERIGSVNTIIRRGDGTLYGDNTDYFGFSYMAKKCGCDFKGKKVLILGSGGASLTVKLVAADEGAREIVVVSRSGEENYANISRHYDADIIVNTTPVGMYPDNGERLIDLSEFTKCKKALDLIYNPARTVFLLDAQKLGIDCINGLYMLVAQALRAAEIFTGKSIPLSRIDEIYDAIISEQKNIVLIGMPGCGKSTCAALLSQKTGRECVDTDALIVENSGEKIPDIFAKYGETEFRNRETEAVRSAGKLANKIIATGGGAILRKKNRIALRENSTVIFLNASVDTLATDGRPLSKDAETLQKMFAQRLPLYKETADFTVEVDGDPETTVRRILKCVSL